MGDEWSVVGRGDVWEDVGASGGIKEGGNKIADQLGEVMGEALEVPGQVGLGEAVVNWIKSIEVDSQVTADA